MFVNYKKTGVSFRYTTTLFIISLNYSSSYYYVVYLGSDKYRYNSSYTNTDITPPKDFNRSASQKSMEPQPSESSRRASIESTEESGPTSPVIETRYPYQQQVEATFESSQLESAYAPQEESAPWDTVVTPQQEPVSETFEEELNLSGTPSMRSSALQSQRASSLSNPTTS
jgi:hypothetical protein